MKISYKKKASGFTLIEMIGVLAVIAILAALLIPKIFEAINNARINNACITVSTVKTAIADHYAKFGSIAYNGSLATPAPINLGTPANGDNFDAVLLGEGFIDKLFEAKVSDNGANTMVRLRTKDATASTTPAADATATDPYDLDGDGDNDTVAAVVAEAVMTGVTEADAREISLRLDGNDMSSAIGTSDLEGRVKYVAANPTTVYIYLTHK